jgi:hypothetical protein
MCIQKTRLAVSERIALWVPEEEHEDEHTLAERPARTLYPALGHADDVSGQASEQYQQASCRSPGQRRSDGKQRR